MGQLHAPQVHEIGSTRSTKLYGLLGKISEESSKVSLPAFRAYQFVPRIIVKKGQRRGLRDRRSWRPTRNRRSCSTRSSSSFFKA